MTITFKEKEYPIREINGYIFATEELSDDLFSQGDILSGEAEAVDNQITYFMPL